MKAITLWQPWASLIALGHKTIETRSWSTNYRGPLAIHASQTVGASLIRGASLPIGEFTIQRDDGRGCSPSYLLRGPIAWPYRLPLGAIVATCELSDVIPMVPAITIGEYPDRNERVVQIGSDGRVCVLDRSKGAGNVVEQLDDQVAYGDYAAGRFAWMLTNIKPLRQPIPAKGHQQIWEWDDASILTGAVA